jgi:voltage-gated potassium channel
VLKQRPPARGVAMSYDEGLVRLPKQATAPLTLLAQRLTIALGLVTLVAMVAYLDRGGYQDAAGDELSLLDAFYYATVSITTTGYGDVIPVSDSARLLTTILVTPARILFLIVLIGTTVEVLVSDTRNAYRIRHWRKTLAGHTIVCGFGATGQAAAQTVLARDGDPSRIVVIEPNADRGMEATSAGMVVVQGDASREGALLKAGIEDAAAVMVAASRDETVVLITLTARKLNPMATIAARVREERNVDIVRQSGADSVVVSAGAAGRLMGHAPDDPRLVELLEDLMSVGQGLDIIKRDAQPDQIGPLSAVQVEGPVIALLRGDDMLRFDDPAAQKVRAGDRLVILSPPSDQTQGAL